MTSPSRRQFLQSALAAGAAAGFSVTPGYAIEPIRRVGPAATSASACAAYSFRQYLDLKKPTMDLEDFIELAADMDLDAVELTAYYFAEHDAGIPGEPQGQMYAPRPRRQRHGHRQQLLRHRRGEDETNR